MPIHVALSHRTSYRYDRLVALSPHIIRLRPAPHCRTPILSYSLKVAPQRHFINWQQDPHGNYLARLVFPDQTRQLLIDVDLTAELSVFNPFDFFLEPSAETFPFAYEPWLSQELAPYLERLPAGPRLRELSRRDRSAPGPHHRFPRRSQPPAGTGHHLHHPARAGRPDARRDARPWKRLVPRHRLAARADPASPRSGGALRLRLPDSAHARCEVAGRSDRSHDRTSPTCTPGRRSTSREPAGSGSTRPPASSPAKATSRSRRRPATPAPRR